MDEAAPRDLVLHYARGAVRGFSVVVAPTRPEQRPYDGGTWNNDGRILDVDYVALDMPIPLNDLPLDDRLSERKPHAAFTHAGAVNQGYFYPLSMELAKTALAIAGIELTIEGHDNRLVINGLTDREGIARVRVEQPALRKFLLEGRTEAPCGLCGDTFPADYLVTAHIKRRADCTERERADANVAMLACKFGCDASFELGHLRVQDDGSITVSGPTLVVPRLARLEAQTASAFTSASRRYFRAHRDAHARSASTAAGRPR